MKLLRSFSDWYFKKSALPYWCILLVDCFLMIASIELVFSLNLGFIEAARGGWDLLGTLCLYMLPFILGFKLMHTYSGVLRFSSFVDLLRLSCSTILGVAIILVCKLLFNLDGILFPVPGAILIEGALVATLLMVIERVLVKFMYDHYFRVATQKHAFIYGVKDGGVAIAKSMLNMKPSIYSLSGFISDDIKDVGKELMAKKTYYLDDNIVTVMKKHHADVLFVSPRKIDDFRENSKFQSDLINAGIKILHIPDAVEWNSHSGVEMTSLKEVEIEDLLPRDKIEVDMQAIGKELSGKVILITGSAGSIGSELVRQIAPYNPAHLVLIDSAETPQHDMRLMMAKHWPQIPVDIIVTTICSSHRMESIFEKFRPQLVVHAAAYKHVPMMEDNPCEAVLNNVRGTQILAKLSIKYGVAKFVMVSTDKAVNPTNVMGCSKRICEIDVQSMDTLIKKLSSDPSLECPFELAPGVERPVTQFVTTRFGNVLGSNGSVIPLFRQQIKNGGPVTVTHPDIIRFFMLIPEACKLVLEAGVMGKGGEIFVFDMGKPVKIAELAERMIKLSGATNVEIKFTGLRDGEKLYEEVLNSAEHTKPTVHPKILVATVRQYDYMTVSHSLDKLFDLAKTYDDMAVVRQMKEIVPEFRSNHSKYEILDKA